MRLSISVAQTLVSAFGCNRWPVTPTFQTSMAGWNPPAGLHLFGG